MYLFYRTLQLELTTISKTIAGLLTQPLSNVVVQLRELKSSQDAKRKQLKSLEMRESSVLKRITSGDEETNEGTTHDMSFGLPLSVEGGKMTEEQRLIQIGQLTPFGGQVQDTTTDAQSTFSPVNDSSAKEDIPTSSYSPSSSSSVSASSGSVSKAASATSSIKLSNDSFDGLFSDTVITKPLKKSSSPKSKHREKKPNKEMTSSHVHIDEQSTRPDVLEQDHENGECDNEEWMPNEAELEMFESEMLSSSDSEYITDDEMGTPQKKKKKRLRELSSDEDEDKDHVTSKRCVRKHKLKRRHYQDDGDDELFRMRIWYSRHSLSSMYTYAILILPLCVCVCVVCA